MLGSYKNSITMATNTISYSLDQFPEVLLSNYWKWISSAAAGDCMSSHETRQINKDFQGRSLGDFNPDNMC